MARRRSTTASTPPSETVETTSTEGEEVQTDGAPDAGEVTTDSAPADAAPDPVAPSPGDPDFTPEPEPAVEQASAPAPSEDSTAAAALQATVDMQAATIDAQLDKIAELEHQLATASIPQPTVEDGVPVAPSGDEPRSPLPVPPEPVAETPFVVSYAQHSTQGWEVGNTAPANRYGITDSTGKTTPTGNGGLDEPPPGSYGALLIREGDVVTAASRSAAGLD